MNYSIELSDLLVAELPSLKKVNLNERTMRISGFRGWPVHPSRPGSLFCKSKNTKLQLFYMVFSVLLQCTLRNMNSRNKPLEIRMDVLSFIDLNIIINDSSIEHLSQA